MYISADHLEAFFSRHEPVGYITPVISKAGISPGDFVLQVTVTGKNILNVPDTLMCQGQRILVIVEGQTPLLVLWCHLVLV